MKSMKKNSFWIKNYRIIFRSRLIEGIIFFLLFVTGLARYRVALVFVARGTLSAVNQYYENKDSNSKTSEYWPLINSCLLGLVFISVLMDISKGQIYPKVPDLPIWITAISIGIGYGFSFLFLTRGGSLIQKMCGEEVFTVCPNCGFANVKVVDKCDNCGYEKGDPFPGIAESQEIPEELQKERDEFKKKGLLRDVPKQILMSVRPARNEYLLIALKSPRYMGGEKDGSMLPAGWLIFTNHRIICLVGLKGWLIKEEIVYDEIRKMNVITKQILTTTRKSLELKTDKHVFRFLIGFTKADKIIEGFFSFDISNEKTITYLANCIRRRNSTI